MRFICKTLGYRVCVRRIEAGKLAELHNMTSRKQEKVGETIDVILAYHMPLVEKKEQGGNLCPCHHIFAKPTDPANMEDCAYLDTMTTESFDIMINGVEIGGGDLRIMDEILLRRMMSMFGVDETRYSLLFEALGETDAVQLGGFAIGLERLVMVLSGCENIKEVTWFSDINVTDS